MMYGIAKYVGNCSEQMVKSSDLYGKEMPFSYSSSSAIPAIEVSGVGITECFYECFLVFCPDAYVYVVGHQAICQKYGTAFICGDV